MRTSLPSAVGMNTMNGSGEDCLDPLRMMVASGPFTPSDNAKFVPLNDLLEVTRNERPHVLILMGPFIDSEHKAFENGSVLYDDMYMSFMDIFLFKGEHVLL